MKDFKPLPKKYVDSRYPTKFFKYKDTKRIFTGKLKLIEENGKFYDSIISDVTELEEIGFVPQFIIRFGIIDNKNGGVLVEDLEDSNFIYIFSLSGFLNGLKKNLIRKVGKFANEFSCRVRLRKRFDSYFIEPFEIDRQRRWIHGKIKI